MMDSTHRPTDTPEYRECPVCGFRTDLDTMIWHHGRCICSDCFVRLEAEEKFKRAEREVRKE